MQTQTHSDQLRQKIEIVLPELAASTNELTDHPNFRDLYPSLLLIMHQGMRASVSLLQTAAARCRELQEEDPVAAILYPYFTDHIEEENHAHWALEDLEVLGIPRAEVLRWMPSPTIASMVGAQYYWVLHHHPVAMLGDMMVREGYPDSIAGVEELIARSGYPRSAFRTLERHAHLDLHHRDDLIELVDRLPLTDEHHAIMGTSALHTIEMIIHANREVLEHVAAMQPA